MGQAFDRDGNVLGEAFGDTKREVFDKLAEQFKDAHEIRIKSLADKIVAAGVRDAPLPARERNRDQAEDPIVVAALTAIVREADETFERVGGSSRHWVRDCFLPILNKHGWFVDAIDPSATTPGTPTPREKASSSESPF